MPTLQYFSILENAINTRLDQLKEEQSAAQAQIDIMKAFVDETERSMGEEPKQKESGKGSPSPRVVIADMEAQMKR